MRSLLLATPAAPADIDGRYAWARLTIAFILATIGGAGTWSIVVAMPALTAEFSVSRSMVAVPYITTMIGFACGNLLMGRAIDRFGTMGPVALAVTLHGTGFLLAAHTASLEMLALWQGIFIGFGSAGTFAPLLADISHWFRRHRGMAVAMVACGSYMAGAVWPLVMQPLIESGGWRMAYLAVGAICLVTALPLTLLLRRKLPVPLHAAAGEDSGAPPLATSLSPGQLQALLVIAGLGCCIAMSMPQVHIVAYCVDLGHAPARGAEMLALMLLAGIASRLGSGWLADRIGGVRTLLIGSFGQFLALCLYIPFDGLASLYMVSMFFGLAQGGIVPSYALIVREYLPAAEAGRRVGLVLMMTIIGMAAGAWMGGFIYDLTGSYAAAFLNGIAWNLVNMGAATIILLRSAAPERAVASRA